MILVQYFIILKYLKYDNPFLSNSPLAARLGVEVGRPSYILTKVMVNLLYVSALMRTPNFTAIIHNWQYTRIKDLGKNTRVS